MNALIQSVSTSGGDWLPFLLDTSLKAVVVLLLAVVITAGLRSASASVRHHVWTLAFVSIVALPFVSRSLPSWEVAVPGWRAEVGETRSAPTRIEAADPPVVATPRGEVASRSGGVTFARPEIAAATRAGSIEVARSPLDPKAVVLWVWLAGLVVMLSRLAAGVCSAWLTTRRAEPVADARWTGVVQELSDRLGIRATVRVLVSDRIATPMAWGTLRPVLLLPSGAGSWSADRRRAVALHELAHIKRRDCLVHLIAQAGRAIHWFNPLAWVGTKRLRAERERACDDLVLTSGTRSADYARLLLDVARGRADRRLSWATVSMARPTELEGRLLAILDPVRDRRGIGRPAAIAALGLSLGVLLPLAAFQAAPQPPVPRAVEPAVAPDAPPAPEREDRRALPAVVPSTAPRPEAPSARADAVDDVLEYRTPIAPEPASVDTLEERALAALVRALASDRTNIRAQAVQALGNLESPRAVENLTSVLRADESPRVRSKAAWALGMIEDASAVPALSDAVDDPEPNVRSQAAWALGMIESSDGVGALTVALDDPEARVRSQAAWALGMIESSDGVAPLVGALSDDSPEVRSQAAWALGMIEDPDAADALIDALEDESDDVAQNAMWALGRVIGN